MCERECKDKQPPPPDDDQIKTLIGKVAALEVAVAELRGELRAARPGSPRWWQTRSTFDNVDRAR